MKQKAFIIERNCCTSGNCVICRELPYGRPARVEHFRTYDKELADIVARNWRLYGAEVKEVAA